MQHRKQQVVTVVGGTGFLGRYVVRHLARAGYTIRVISRYPSLALHLKTSGAPGQIVLMEGNIGDPRSLAGKLDPSFAVINLVGILFESGRQRFGRLHAQGAGALAQLAADAGAQRFIQISALGVDKARSSKYARSKLEGEKAVLDAFPAATILRPSIVFGPEDNFFNQFAAMATIAPALPLIGGGKTRFQPVYAGDVAQAAATCLERPDSAGRTYELGGPRVYTFKEILEYILRAIGKTRMLLPLPMPVASLIGLGSELLPRPPITRDQVRLLKTDNVVSDGALTFADLGIAPAAVEAIVPGYLARFAKKAA